MNLSFKEIEGRFRITDSNDQIATIDGVALDNGGFSSRKETIDQVAILSMDMSIEEAVRILGTRDPRIAATKLAAMTSETPLKHKAAAKMVMNVKDAEVKTETLMKRAYAKLERKLRNSGKSDAEVNKTLRIHFPTLSQTMIKDAMKVFEIIYTTPSGFKKKKLEAWSESEARSMWNAARSEAIASIKKVQGSKDAEKKNQTFSGKATTVYREKAAKDTRWKVTYFSTVEMNKHPKGASQSKGLKSTFVNAKSKEDATKKFKSSPPGQWDYIEVITAA